MLAGPGVWTFPVDSSSRRRGKYTPSLCFLRSQWGSRGITAWGGGWGPGARPQASSTLWCGQSNGQGSRRPCAKAIGWTVGVLPAPATPTPGLPLKGLEMGHLGARLGSLWRVEQAGGWRWGPRRHGAATLEGRQPQPRGANLNSLKCKPSKRRSSASAAPSRNVPLGSVENSFYCGGATWNEEKHLDPLACI